MEKVIVTTSWDDGHRLDKKLSELLSKYGVKGTFYVSPYSREIAEVDRLSDSDIAELSHAFEIGAHTMTHRHLIMMSEAEAEKEIRDSKTYLERITGKPVSSFCYPAGYYDARNVEMVREAGFKVGRTVKRFKRNIDDPLQLSTTVHAYRHWSDLLSILRHGGVRRFFSHYFNWDTLAIKLFDKAAAEGGVFHLWGHSWEIEKNGDWDRLERVLAYVSKHPSVRFVSNDELV